MIDGVDIVPLIEAIGLPAFIGVLIVWLMVKNPPRPPVTPEADLLIEIRKMNENLAKANERLHDLAEMKQGQKELQSSINLLSLTMSELNGRLSVRG